MNYVYSTLTADNEYSTGAGPVVIYGRNGARMRGKIETPKGVATRVTEEQLAALEGHLLFAKHVKDGFISVQRKELTESKVEKLIDENMEKGDKAAQETDASLKAKRGANRKKDDK